LCAESRPKYEAAPDPADDVAAVAAGVTAPLFPLLTDDLPEETEEAGDEFVLATLALRASFLIVMAPKTDMAAETEPLGGWRCCVPALAAVLAAVVADTDPWDWWPRAVAVPFASLSDSAIGSREINSFCSN
jgi:anti-sigma-K factor RskA